MNAPDDDQALLETTRRTALAWAAATDELAHSHEDPARSADVNDLMDTEQRTRTEHLAAVRAWASGSAPTRA